MYIIQVIRKIDIKKLLDIYKQRTLFRTVQLKKNNVFNNPLFILEFAYIKYHIKLFMAHFKRAILRDENIFFRHQGF